MKYIDDADLENKKVILRLDYNVPIENDKIVDNTRIIRSLKTINYLMENNCSIIILSHRGRVNIREDKLKNSLSLVAQELEKLILKKVTFIPQPVGMEVLNACKSMKQGDIILLENTRFCDFPEKLESKNDLHLANYWASLADIFIVDAFASLHRCHASVAGISKYIPTYFGFLVKEEIENLSTLNQHISRPFAVFMGGAKVDDKLKYIKKLLPKCDYLLLGGGIANSFLYALGYDIGDSVATNDEITIKELKELVNNNHDKIILPIDFVIDGNKIYDLGEKSINKYINYLSNCKTIFINGTCGMFEKEEYSHGTRRLFKALKDIDGIKIAGGGDTINCINKYDLKDSFSYLSSGGGASIEFVSNEKLDAIEFINND